MSPSVPAEAPPDCQLCPRLVEFREENRVRLPDGFNGAVPSFGDPDGRLLILGLAPGLKGANYTGRPFTGDYAGDLLYATLLKLGLAEGSYGGHAGDGLVLKDCLISNAVRCVPPQNKPTPAESNTCRKFLIERIKAMPNLRAILALGKIAHDSALRGLGYKLSAAKFAHCAETRLDGPNGPLTLVDSYHCSRYNTNTGRLTEAMFEEAMGRAKAVPEHRIDPALLPALEGAYAKFCARPFPRMGGRVGIFPAYDGDVAGCVASAIATHWLDPEKLPQEDEDVLRTVKCFRGSRSLTEEEREFLAYYDALQNLRALLLTALESGKS